jgi:hypothetical protein
MIASTITRSARAVLRRLVAAKGWEHGQAALAEVVDYSARTVRRALAELCAAGLVARTSRVSGRGRACDLVMATALGEALMSVPVLARAGADVDAQPMQLAVGCPPLAVRSLRPASRSGATLPTSGPQPLSRAAVDRPASTRQKRCPATPQLHLLVSAPVSAAPPQSSPGPAGSGNERMVRGPAGGAVAKEAREAAKKKAGEEKAARAELRRRKVLGEDVPALPEVLAAWRDAVAAARPPLLAVDVVLSGRAISAARGYVGRLLRLVAVGRPLADGDREEVVRRARLLFAAALATERPSFPLGLEIVCMNPDRYQGAVRKGPMTPDERRALALQGCGHVKPGREMGNTGDPESRARTLAKLAAMGIKRDA